MKSRHTRVRAALCGMLIVAAIGQYACRDAPTAPASATQPQSFASINAPGDSGAPEIIFLAPLGPKTHPHGELDTTLAPSVTICRLNGDACGVDTVARFSSDSTADSTGEFPSRVLMSDHAYHFRWKTRDLPADSSIAYRIVVALADTTVGFTDLKIVSSAFSPAAEDTSRYAFITERNGINVRFQVFVPPVTLTVIAEPGVHGDLTSQTYTFRRGERVLYSFAPDSGYRNLLVSLDQNSIATQGRITMDDSHVLIASADRDVSVAPGDEWILHDARALLRASNKVNSAQKLLDRLDEMTDTVNIEERLRTVELTLLKRDADAAAMPALDAALDGHTFDVGDGDGDGTGSTPPGGGGSSGPPIASAMLVPLGTAGAAGTRAQLRPSATIMSPTENGAESVTIAYVNGILTTPMGALFAAHHVALAARTAQWYANVPFDIKLIYNRSAMSDQTSAEDRCVLALGISGDWLGLNSLPAELAKCLNTTTPRALALLADYVEAGTELASVLDHSASTRPPDVDTVAAFANRVRNAGRHVVFVMHSQGNLVVQQALTLLRTRGQYSQAQDTTCIGAVALAAPTSEAWPISSRHLYGLAVDGDIILSLGRNKFPRVRTALSDSAAHETTGSLAARIKGLATGASLRWGVRLHSAVESYLTQPAMRGRIQDAIVKSYRSCALGSINVTPQMLELQPGESRRFQWSLTDMTGDPLDGLRGVDWLAESKSDWQQAVQLSPDGAVAARYVGGTSVTARSRSVLANAGVTVSAAPLGVAAQETLTARWIVLGIEATNQDPIPEFVIPATGWDGGSCSQNATFTSNGRTGTFSKQCEADYRVTTEAVPGAKRYTATFFHKGATNALFTVSGTGPTLHGSVSGPEATFDLLPGPTLLDRIVVSAYDAAGHLLAQGAGCVHACQGWPEAGG